MLRRLALGLCLIPLALGAVRSEPKHPPQSWKKLAGTWQPHSRESNGKREIAPREVAENLELVLSEDKIVAKEDGKASNVAISAKIDPEKDPAQVDFIVTLDGDKPKPEKTCLGIYKVEGDTLTICYREPGRDVKRPSEFATKDGDNAILLVLKRKKGR